jgi:hypothetical protein
MIEVFRFMSIRSVQLADPSTAIDLTTYLSTAAAAPAPRGRAKRPAAPAIRGRNAPIAPAALSAPKPPSALKFVKIYDTIGTKITDTGFDATTLGAVISQAIGKGGLSAWVQQPNYISDKNDAAVALIAAHLRPPADRTVETLARYVRIMNLMDSLAGGSAISDTAELRSYMSAMIMAPAGVMPLTTVGPPYNPYVIPAGVADLQLVKQELIGYEKKEISYIANVLQSETNKRVTVRFEKTDQTFTTTTDTTTQTEQDAQSAERFQVQTQAQKTIQDDSNLKFGLSVSASYGPSVNVKSNFDYGSSQATSTSNSVSTSYGKDITTRSVNKVTQEVTQQQRLDIINSFSRLRAECLELVSRLIKQEPE